MSLIFAAFTPHSPLLIPDIGKEHINKLKVTKESLETLEKELYVAQPDVIFVISPHGHIFPDAFTINANPTLKTDFREFGDLTTTSTYENDLSLIANIANASRNEAAPVVSQSQETLDYGAGVPLFYLAKHLPNVKIIPITYSLLDYKKHHDFGHFLKEIIMDTNKRVAVIASGDLSHRLSSDSPEGFSPSGQEFDQLILESLKTGNTTNLLNYDPKKCDETGECGLRALLILLGILRNMQYNLKIHSYESPFGIGYLTAEFLLD